MSRDPRWFTDPCEGFQCLQSVRPSQSSPMPTNSAIVRSASSSEWNSGHPKTSSVMITPLKHCSTPASTLHSTGITGLGFQAARKRKSQVTTWYISFSHTVLQITPMFRYIPTYLVWGHLWGEQYRAVLSFGLQAAIWGWHVPAVRVYMSYATKLASLRKRRKRLLRLLRKFAWFSQDHEPFGGCI